MRAFQRRFRKEDAVVGDDADRHTVQMGKAADQRATVKLLEFIELAAVDQARDDFTDIEGLAQAACNDAVEILDRVFRFQRRS